METTVTSHALAREFNERHEDIIKVIDEIFEDDSDFAKTCFTPLSDGAYLMTKTGYTLTIMRLESEQAIAWKIDFIKMYNKMEACINGQEVN